MSVGLRDKLSVIIVRFYWKLNIVDRFGVLCTVHHLTVCILYGMVPVYTGIYRHIPAYTKRDVQLINLLLMMD